MDFLNKTERVGVMRDHIKYRHRYRFNNVLIMIYQEFEYNRLQLFAGYFLVRATHCVSCKKIKTLQKMQRIL